MFGQYAILDSKRYTLEKEPEWYWEFKVITSKDEVTYAQWQDAHVRHVEIDGRPVSLAPMGFEAAWYELAMSFAGTNIPGDDGTPIVKPEMSMDEKQEVLKTFPGDLLSELWLGLKSVYPFLGPRLTKPKEEEGSTETDPSSKS